jgi:spermidine/putrescine transport system ATP-binding protein
VGDPVVLHWQPAHTFALDAAQSADAGSEKIEGDE